MTRLRGIIALIILLLLTARVPARGSLLIIGGALEPDNAPIYEKFIRAGGGAGQIRIAIIPAASARPQRSADSYRKDFIQYGVSPARIRIFPLAMVDDPGTPSEDESAWYHNRHNRELALELAEYNAVFFTGGDQARIREIFFDGEGEGGLLLKTLRRIYAEGGIIAGTSAGAAIMSDPMICRGEPLLSLFYPTRNQWPCDDREEQVQVTRGPGFLPGILVDQHFNQRRRLGRLLSALTANHRGGIGIGVDENTAVFYRQGWITVLGQYAVTLVRLPPYAGGFSPQGLEMTGASLVILSAGERLCLSSPIPEFRVFRSRRRQSRFGNRIRTSPLVRNLLKEAPKETPVIISHRKIAEGWEFCLKEKTTGRVLRMTIRVRRYRRHTAARIDITPVPGSRSVAGRKVRTR